MAFSLNYAFVIIIVVVGVFAVIYAAMPSDLFINQSGYSNPNLVNQSVRERFEASDLISYSSFASDQMNLGYTSITDAPSPPQWNTTIVNRYIEVWWDIVSIPDVGPIGVAFQIRDTEKRNFPVIGDYYVNLETCQLYLNGTYIGPNLWRTTLEPYENETQVTLTAQGKFVSVSLILMSHSDTDTLGNSWDVVELLNYAITYELDFSAAKPSAWQLISQLVTFQSPEFGVPGLFGEVLSYMFGIGFWAAIALIAYTILTKLIPTVQGGIEN